MKRKVGLGALVVLFSASLGRGQEADANQPAIRAVLTGRGLNMALVWTNDNDAVISFGELATNTTVPKQARKLFVRALKADGKGDLKGAMENLEAATRMAPAFLQAHAALAVGCLKEEKLSEAEQHTTIALALDPHYLPAREIKGLILLFRGRSREAADLLTGLLKHAPSRNTIHTFLGLALLDLGDQRGATEHLRTGAALLRRPAPSSAEVLHSWDRTGPADSAPFPAGYDSRTNERHR